jgi:hypothetical protein
MAVVVATASVTFGTDDADKDLSASVEVMKRVDGDIPYVSQSEFRLGDTAYFLLYLSAGASVKKVIPSMKRLSVFSSGTYTKDEEDFLSFQVYEAGDNNAVNEVKTKYPMTGTFSYEYYGDDLGTPLALSDQTLRVPNYGISSVAVKYRSRALVYALNAPLNLKLYKGKAKVDIVFVCEKK